METVTQTGLTWALLLTPEGIIVAAGLVNRLVELLKTVVPQLDASVSGARLTFIVSGLLYVVAGAIVGVADPNLWLTILSAFLACAGGSIGIQSSLRHVEQLPLKRAVTTDAIILEAELAQEG